MPTHIRSMTDRWRYSELQKYQVDRCDENHVNLAWILSALQVKLLLLGGEVKVTLSRLKKVNNCMPCPLLLYVYKELYITMITNKQQ